VGNRTRERDRGGEREREREREEGEKGERGECLSVREPIKLID